MTRDPKANPIPGAAAVSDDELDSLFAAARAEARAEATSDITPSPALLAAILDDAEVWQPAPTLSGTVPNSTQAPADLSHAELEDLFAAARDVETQPKASHAVASGEIAPSTALVSAILADAEHHRPARPKRAMRPDTARPEMGGFWSELKEAFGGWFGVGGLVAASVTGVVIGVGLPETAVDMTAFLGVEEVVVDAYGAGFDLLLEEG